MRSFDDGTYALNRLRGAVEAVKLARTSGDERSELDAYADLDAAWQALASRRDPAFLKHQAE